VPALSLLIQIVNTRDRVLYGRRGGIQPAAYHDWVKGSNAPFQTVKYEDLLKDNQRIERAARVATLPLVHTPKEISLGDANPEINAKQIDISTLPALPPGKLYKDESPLLVPRDEILQKVHRVALSPVENVVDEAGGPEVAVQILDVGPQDQLLPRLGELDPAQLDARLVLGRDHLYCRIGVLGQLGLGGDRLRACR